MDAAERIKYFRERAGLSPPQLAALLELAPGEIEALEQGKRVLDLDLIPALVRALGSSYDEFFGTRRLAEDFQTEILIQKISALDPRARREIEQFVDFKIEKGRREESRRSADRRVVLIVDDDRHVRQTLVQAVNDLTPHRVLEAPDADSAIRLLEEEEVDLLITDLVMPRVSGIDLIEKVRLVDADLPIIALTGYTDIFDANDTLDVDVIRGKPLSLQGLVDDLERLLEASDDGVSGV